jgi:hypothetical protein
VSLTVGASPSACSTQQHPAGSPTRSSPVPPHLVKAVASNDKLDESSILPGQNDRRQALLSDARSIVDDAGLGDEL